MEYIPISQNIYIFLTEMIEISQNIEGLKEKQREKKMCQEEYEIGFGLRHK